MKEKKMNMRGTAVGLGLVTALAWFTFRILSKKHFMKIPQRVFQRANIRYMLMGCLYMAVFINCEAANIRLLMRTFRKTTPLRHSLSYACAGLYFSAITPSAVGEQPMQPYYMTRSGFGLAQSSLTLLTVVATYQMSVLLYRTTVAIVRLPFIATQSRVIRCLLVFGILVSGACSCAIPLTILNGLLTEQVGICIIGFLTRTGVIRNKKKAQRRVEGLIMEYSRGGAYLREYPLVILRIFLRSMIQLTALLLVPYFACLVLGIDAEPGNFLAMQAISSLAVTAVPPPGSAEASEGGFMALYSPLLEVGQTLPVMMLSRGASFYGSLVINSPVTAYLQFRPYPRATGEGKQQVIGVDVDRWPVYNGTTDDRPVIYICLCGLPGFNP